MIRHQNIQAMNSDSDDDFLDKSFMPSTKSKKRPRNISKYGTPTKSAKKSKPSNALDIRNKSPKKSRPSSTQSQSETAVLVTNPTSNVSHCVFCQMPFDLLLRWESPEVHASSCLETDFSKLPPCVKGNVH